MQEDFAIGIVGTHMFSKELSEAEFMVMKSDSLLQAPESDL
jgi:hypothetical protein